MAGPNDFQTISTALLNFENSNFPRMPGDDTTVVAMLVGAGLESDWRANAAGGGAWQITDKVQFDPTDLASAIRYMWPRYSAAVAADAGMPEGSAKYADIAFKAERPAAPYAQTQGQQKVDSVYHTVMTNYGAPGSTAQAPVNTQIGGAFLGPVVGFLSQLTDVRMWRSLGWIGLGLLVLLLGLALWLRKDIGSTLAAAKMAE